MATPSAASNPVPPVPSFDRYPVTDRLTAATTDGATVLLSWSDGHESRFHTIFLRDHAMVPGTYNAQTREHVCEVDSYPSNLRMAAVAVDEHGALAAVFEPEGLTARFHPGWLRSHDYSLPSTSDADDIQPEPWAALNLSEPPTIDGRAILTDDTALAQWLVLVARFGIARLTGVSPEEEMVRHVAERIGPIRVSNFGGVFDVRSKVEPDSNAYTGLPLFPHTDLSTREYEPGLQLLHCLENDAPGGSAVYVDGYRVAEDLRRDDPDTFAALTSIPWSFANRAPDTDYRYRTPIIVLSSDGSIGEIRLTGFLRAPLRVEFDDVPRAYEAMRRLCQCLRDPRYLMRFSYQPGDLIMFDNRRILHGRDAFEPGAGSRWLQGCYSEREELWSRLRVLRRSGIAIP